ncbi:MAG: inorganic phosphate transporter [Proteobacteria bacterium]|jgi:PiT family inorganic phosphate transporter|nr:inorganic phosphate transporter [Pseudomonadota bacterium]
MPDPGTLAILATVVVLALAFDFINGFHDTANSIATSVSTRVLSPRQAILMAAGLNFLGALMSHSVAKTISSGLIDAAMVPEYVVIATLVAAIAWNLITWYFGIPSSSSHALIGGLLGSSIAFTASLGIVKWHGVLEKVVVPLVTSPVVGLLLGFLFMKLLFLALSWASPQFVNRWFSKLQIVSAAFVSYTHGMNDAQKSMGIITFALIGSGILPASAEVPVWVMIACAVSMAFGTAAGGWRIIKTMGLNMIRLQPINGFAAETGAAVVIAAASAIGAPVSTTHVISSSIMGVGAAKRPSAVRWMLARSIVWAWVLTIPTTAAIGALVVLAIKAGVALLGADVR